MAKFFSFTIAALSFIVGAIHFTSADACTGIKLKATDGSTVHGRTLEFGIPVEISIAAVPRGYEFIGTTPQGSGLKYLAKYSAIGAIAFNNPALMDGINEKGLSVGTFYFPGYASYTPITSQNQSKALSPVEFSNWLLVSFSSIDQIKAALSEVVIAPTVNKEWGNASPPFHYIVFDKNGQSLVIEPMDGKLLIYPNPIGVLTNSPDFKWHMSNLRNFINLTPFNVSPITINGNEFAPFGQGSGMVGLPGDFTPPSRFVRAAIFSATATPSKDSQEAIFQGFHILNQFDIPIGVARQKENESIHSDFTQATVMRDPQELKYYFTTYKDQNIRMVDLTKINLETKNMKTFNAALSSTEVKEITTELR